MPKQPGLDGRHRDVDGEIHKKRSDTQAKTLRKEYGENFLPGVRDDTQLGSILKRKNADSLSELLRDRSNWGK